MRRLTTVLMILLLAITASADSFGTLGYREDTVIQDDTDDDCFGTPIYNHDLSFENGYCWQMDGIVPPYYGAWGEAFDTGTGTVECGLYWLTALHFWQWTPLDAYVWEGGVSGAPSCVLCVVPGITGLHLPYWPSCGLNEIEIGCCVNGEFAVGFWGDFSPDICEWYICVDENGSGGTPWTCIAPGIGYPTGWQHPSVVFSDCVSLGLGATITDEPSPPESPTWGSIKALFGE